MNKPQRIQKSRKLGYKMQRFSMNLNGLPAQYCGRPTRFGNPFKLIGDMIYVYSSHRRNILDRCVYYSNGNINDVVQLFDDMLNDPESRLAEPEIVDKFVWMRENIHELKGKNIACFCNLSTPCHCDSLIKYIEK